MKKYFKFLPFLFLGFCSILNSCSKEDVNNERVSLNSELKITTGNLTFTNNNRLYVFNENYSNPNFIIEEGTGIFLSESIGLINVINQPDGSISLSSENLPYDITIEENSSLDSFNATFNNVTKEHFVFNSGYSNISNYLDDIRAIGSFNSAGSYQTMACPPCVVLVVYLVVDSLADHCDSIIVTGTNACRGEDKCFDVGVCSVECKKC
ncbi:hypothetical protein [Nonlabens ulvanivorans]|uniref:Uncharacterized protein n=1 Tax=Nonlabens ulvanivorans TaxID=906888 RepID=A0A084JV66_NONUL|nr:hypothetical protein [Nonlabens ulvanivorans]KEZ92850.1 hypothetical protein IL45_12015 [Nonlabens ulvanivorans]PRX15705.1 hypothetical protein LY02_00928 [Nonlabens ulvanivorans]